ncbi:MAG: FliM/FliN family flagellar motor switch protein, partial [Alphaproteobacteria bacterium]|nr:FliM/FliN family flagellar motor switch protein [Alphaproteobacteria bacterium]
TAEMKVSNLLKIGRGAVIELDKHVGDTIELHVAGRPIARGEVVVVEDHLAVSVTEVFKIGMYHDTK